MLTVSLSHLTITMLHWGNMIEIMINVSLNQHTITIILLAGLLDWFDIFEIMLNVSLNQHSINPPPRSGRGVI